MFNKSNVTIILYFSFALLLAPFHLLSFDTYYYWEWSRHLALSYYDGSPLIAYFIKISTMLFGDTLFALSFVGIAVTALTSIIVYRTARLTSLNQEASYVTMLLWLFSPLVTLDLLNQTTYDTPLTLFWALTIYWAIKYIKYNKTIDLYWMGASIGLMLLSKYSGVVLLLSFAIFLITTKYRHLFKSIHFYWALLLATVIFSPVIVWNYQHHWVSFLYQLNTHQLVRQTYPLWSAFTSFFTIFVPSINFLLVAPVVYALKTNPKKSLPLYLCFVVCATFLCFYVFVAGKATIRGFWLGQFLITSSLLAGYCYQKLNYRKSTWLLIGVYAAISVGILLSNTNRFSFSYSKKLAYYEWVQAFNKSKTELPETIITTGWFEARMLFFLKNKPPIYTLDCGSLENQYALWSVENSQKIKNKTIKKALYIDIIDRSQCIKKYFDHCEPHAFPTLLDEKRRPILFVYNCSNAG